MLCAVTSSLVCWASMPEAAVASERNIFVVLSVLVHYLGPPSSRAARLSTSWQPWITFISDSYVRDVLTRSTTPRTMLTFDDSSMPLWTFGGSPACGLPAARY